MTETSPRGDTDPLASLPLSGPGSYARLVPRAIALFIDWMLCSLIAAAFLGYKFKGGGGEGFEPLAIFVVENVLLVSLIGTTIGHRIMGMVVQKPSGQAPGFVAGIIRTLLLALVIPAIVMDRWGRGLHDRLAGTVILRTR